MPGKDAASTIALLFGCFTGCAGGAADRSPTAGPAAAVVPAPPPAAAREARPDPQALSPMLELCEPEESETCICPDESTGSRRCNETGTAFGPCEACPDPLVCGARTCESLRISVIALTLPGCCAHGSERCGVDVGFVAKNYGLSFGCLELDAEGKLDPGCPSVDVPIPERGSTTLRGCRTPGGACGYDVDVPDVIDLGCVDVR